jgi:hypothetical protein
MIERIQPAPERWWSSELQPHQNVLRLDALEVPSLPLDLTTWVDTSSLLVWIEEEILLLDWNNPLVVEHLKNHPGYRPKTMLALLCLGYSSQVFSSHEIHSRCHSNPAFALLCDGEVPFANELTRFRRKNRILIAEVLARVFKKIWRSQCISAVASDAWEKEIHDIALARLDIARHMDACD